MKDLEKLADECRKVIESIIPIDNDIAEVERNAKVGIGTTREYQTERGERGSMIQVYPPPKEVLDKWPAEPGVIGRRYNALAAKVDVLLAEWRAVKPETVADAKSKAEALRSLEALARVFDNYHHGRDLGDGVDPAVLPWAKEEALAKIPSPAAFRAMRAGDPKGCSARNLGERFYHLVPGHDSAATPETKRVWAQKYMTGKDRAR